MSREAREKAVDGKRLSSRVAWNSLILNVFDILPSTLFTLAKHVMSIPQWFPQIDIPVFCSKILFHRENESSSAIRAPILAHIWIFIAEGLKSQTLCVIGRELVNRLRFNGVPCVCCSGGEIIPA